MPCTPTPSDSSGAGASPPSSCEALGGRGLALDRVTVSDTSAEVLARLKARFPAIADDRRQRGSGGVRAGLPRPAPARPEGRAPRDRAPIAAGRGRGVPRACPHPRPPLGPPRAASPASPGSCRTPPRSSAPASTRWPSPRAFRRTLGPRSRRSSTASGRTRWCPRSRWRPTRSWPPWARPTSGSSGGSCASWPRRSASAPTDADEALRAMLDGAVRTFFDAGLTPEQVLDLVPVKPLAEAEAQVRAGLPRRAAPSPREAQGGLSRPRGQARQKERRSSAWARRAPASAACPRTRRPAGRTSGRGPPRPDGARDAAGRRRRR